MERFTSYSIFGFTLCSSPIPRLGWGADDLRAMCPGLGGGSAMRGVSMFGSSKVQEGQSWLVARLRRVSQNSIQTIPSSLVVRPLRIFGNLAVTIRAHSPYLMVSIGPRQNTPAFPPIAASPFARSIHSDISIFAIFFYRLVLANHADDSDQGVHLSSSQPEHRPTGQISNSAGGVNGKPDPRCTSPEAFWAVGVGKGDH